MKRVFLSYAREDEVVAERLARWLRTKDIELYWFQNAEQRGRRFIGEIERGIAEADLFVVLLSPHFLTSSWCRHERDLAFQREIDLRRPFIYVLDIAETSSYPDSGFLRSYDWLDATEPLTSKLDAIEKALPLGKGPSPSAQPRERSTRPAHLFRNREDEVNKLVNTLTTTDACDLWVVVAPPRMGKSWLLDRVQRELATNAPRWTVRLLDLREQPADLRFNASRLLGSLLDVDVEEVTDGGPPLDRDLRNVAATLSRRSHPQLYVLDSADLLDTVCAVDVRSALTTVYRLVKRSGARDTRLALVIGTRRHDEWRGLGGDPRAGLRFEPHPLTKFRIDVAHRALADLGLNHGADLQWRYAEQLHELSEGLPALLVRSLSWATETAFLAMDECNSDATFDHVARPYIQEDLLAPESLLPSGSLYPRQAVDVLERALRVLTAYRLYTQSHLRHHLEADPTFQAALMAARWSRAELWDALGGTSLCDQPAELWQEIEPSIRRLLYRYYNRTDGDRAAAHVAARDFHLGWTVARTAGREQQVVLVECLWHEASRMVIEQPDEVSSLLPAIAAEVAQEFVGSPMYDPREFAEFVVKRLRDDDEFQMLLQSYDGVFGEITKSVVRTIGDS